MSRVNRVILIAGNRGKGKTDFLKQQIMSSKQPLKLVVDTFDSPVWRNLKTWNHNEWELINVPIIMPNELTEKSTGIYRTFSADTNGIMDIIQRRIYNSLLVFEDATKYIGNRLTDDVRFFVLDSKQKNLDIIFTFHSLADIPKDLIRISDYLTLFKTGDSFDSYLRSKYKGKPVEELFHKIQSSNDNYINKTIDISS